MNTTTKPQIDATTASRVRPRREAIFSPPAVPSRVCGVLSISITFPDYISQITWDGRGRPAP